MTRAVAVGTLSIGVLWGVAVSADEEGAKKEDSNAIESVHEDIKEGTQKVASDAGVKGTVVHGAKYGPAGCGLGSLIFDPDSGFTQIFAATTNGTFGTQTFGISSGTSNCDDTDGGSESAKAFVETNRSALAKEIARGGGENITALSQLAGCPDVSRVGQTLQRNFTVIFPDSAVSDQNVGSSVVHLLKSEPTLGCRGLG